jgi:hypothetical protein
VGTREEGGRVGTRAVECGDEAGRASDKDGGALTEERQVGAGEFGVLRQLVIVAELHFGAPAPWMLKSVRRGWTKVARQTLPGRPVVL